MAPAHSSTIAAIASPTGVGAISLIRISGPRAIEIADLACGGIASATMPRVARRCKIRDAAGSVIDDGLLTVFLCPNSFTGEDTVEFAGHGGILVTRETLARFLECGAVHAAPGEFSQRAFLNGKLDLTQAEGDCRGNLTQGCRLGSFRLLDSPGLMDHVRSHVNADHMSWHECDPD
jgi:tRNA modification GTPase